MSKDTIRNGYIYKITCKKNGKVYIGETGRFVTLRWNDYVSAYERGYFTHSCPNNEEGTLLGDMIKFGLECFSFEVVEVMYGATKNDRLKQEEHYINMFKSNDVKNGYNNIASFSENATSHIDSFVSGGEYTRFKKGDTPHNSQKVFACSLKNGEIISFRSYNQATRFLLDNVVKDSTKFHSVNRLVKIASKKNQEYCGYKWETAHDTDYSVEKYDIQSVKKCQPSMCLLGETFYNNKGLEFCVVEVLKENKRKIRFSNSGYETISNTKEILNGSIKDWYSPSVCGIGIIGLEIINPQSHPLYDKWRGILRRCSNSDNVKVCDEWLLFGNFVKDVDKLTNDKNITDLSKVSIRLSEECTTYSPNTITIKKIGE